MEIVQDGPTLVLSGAFDARSTWEVRTAIYELLGSHAGDVVVDLTDVAAVDLTALKVLAVATREASHQGHHLRLRGCSAAVRRMMALSHLRRLVEVERQVS
jgi:anti-anti-sigma factor